MSATKELRVEEIFEHPVNAKIYGDKAPERLVQSVREHGVMTPVIVFYDTSECRYVCLSGHSRLNAARQCSIETVSAYVEQDDMPEWLQLQKIVELNQGRDKTIEQKTRETEALEKSKVLFAQDRQKAGVKAEGDEVGDALTLAAKETGLGSRPTAKKAIEVVRKIDELEESGDNEAAEKLRTALNKGNVSAAKRMATATEKPAESEVSAPGENAESENSVGVALDQLGKPVPEELAEPFNSRSEYEEIVVLIDSLKKRLIGTPRNPGLAGRVAGNWLDSEALKILLGDLKKAVTEGEPFSICPECRCAQKKRESCRLCRQLGFISFQVHDSLPPNSKTWLANRKSN